MPSSSLGRTNGRTTLGVACHHSPWTANTVERRQACHAITAFGQHTRSKDVGFGMPSSPLGSTNGQTTSGVAYHHRLREAHTVERRRTWHAITALGLHTRSTMSGVALHHHPWTARMVGRRRAWYDITALRQHTRSNDVGRGMTLISLNYMHGRTSSVVACNHRH